MFSGSNRTFIFAGGGILVILGLVFVLMRPSFPYDADPEIAKIEKLERSKDVKGLTEALHASRDDVATRAMVGLGRVAGKDALPELANLLKDPRAPLRSAAAAQYAVTAERGAVGPLVEAFKTEKDPQAKAALAAALGQNRGWDGVAVLIPALDDANPQVRMRASEAMLNITGLKPQLSEKSTPAERRRTIAQLISRMASMKSGYDRYWATHSSKEKP